jgi:hypothetical protein
MNYNENQKTIMRVFIKIKSSVHQLHVSFVMKNTRRFSPTGDSKISFLFSNTTCAAFHSAQCLSYLSSISLACVQSAVAGNTAV